MEIDDGKVEVLDTSEGLIGRTGHILKQIYESVVVFVITRLYVLDYNMVLVRRRLFLFGVISVLLCLLISGTQLMVMITTTANFFLKEIDGYVGINNESVGSVLGMQWKDVEAWIKYTVTLVQEGLIKRVYFIVGISVLLFVFFCVYIAITKLRNPIVRFTLRMAFRTTRYWLRNWLRHLVSKEEILKSIVYGGLTEIIASISIVAFFADFDTTILNVKAFALAGLIGGCCFLVTNIWELKKGGGDRYKVQLGRAIYFPFHATLAMLSFIIFGIIPPSTFVFTFHKTNDKKIAIWVVSAVSLLCLSLLAIFKAYVTSIKYRFKYIKTVLWYHLMAMGVSICSYLVSKMV